MIVLLAWATHAGAQTVNSPSSLHADNPHHARRFAGVYCENPGAFNIAKGDDQAPLASLPVNTWVKLSPLPEGPASPRMGYEGDCRWLGRHQLLLRYGGHNQGGGGEQGSEVWLFDPRDARWTIRLPNTSPPGVCCAQQNVVDEASGRYLRFPAFSAGHGWQWHREVYLNNTSVWAYDIDANTWRNRRPLPEPRVSPLRCTSWDSDHQVIVMFGGEGNHEGTRLYDPYTNTWTLMRPPVEPETRSGGNMVYDQAHKLHILFGSQFSDDRHTWAYDLRQNRWIDMKPANMPPTDKNDAVLTYDPINKIVLAIIKQTEGEDEDGGHTLSTWAYDAGKNEWRQLNPPREPDASGNRARQLTFAAKLNLAILENCTSKPREQQIWAYRYAEAPAQAPEAPVPESAAAIVTEGGVELRWRLDAPAEVSYKVYRGTAAQPWMAEFKPIAVGVPPSGNGNERRLLSWRDRDPVKEVVSYYRIAAVDKTGRESQPSSIIRNQPPSDHPLLVTVTSSTSVALRGEAGGAEVTGHEWIIERAAVEVYSDDQLKMLKSRTPPLATPSVGALRRIGAFETVARTNAPAFTDQTIDLGRPAAVVGAVSYEREYSAEQLDAEGRPYPLAVYAYRLRSVNALGVVSGASPAVLTIPSSPQHVLAREAGGSCELKWNANPEQGIVGYHVYRMNGRWDKDPIARLTPQPIQATMFADKSAGHSTRRYYIVAVDTLGQEGFPSAPVWHRREWDDYYKPFVGEWRQ